MTYEEIQEKTNAELRQEAQERAERNKRQADKRVREIEVVPIKDLREVKEEKQEKQSLLSKIGSALKTYKKTPEERKEHLEELKYKAEVRKLRNEHYGGNKESKKHPKSDVRKILDKISGKPNKKTPSIRYIKERTQSSGSMGLGGNVPNPVGNVPSGGSFMSMELGGVPTRQHRVSRPSKIQHPVGEMNIFSGVNPVGSFGGIPSKRTVRKQSKKLQRFEEPDFGQNMFNSKSNKYKKNNKSFFGLEGF